MSLKSKTRSPTDADSVEAGVRAIIEEAVDAFFQGDHTGRLIRVNELSCALTGYTREELLSMSLADLFSADELAREPLRFDLLMAGKMLTKERNMMRQDGSTVPIEMRSRQMSDGSYQSIFRDLTERKRACAGPKSPRIRATGNCISIPRSYRPPKAPPTSTASNRRCSLTRRSRTSRCPNRGRSSMLR